MNLSQLRSLLLVIFFGTSTLAVAHDHRDHLWSGDSHAYKSFRDAAAPSAVNGKGLTGKKLGSTWPSGGQPAPTPSPTTRAPRTSTIDSKYLDDSLVILSGEKDVVLANRGKQAGKLAARKFLREEFESFGYTVTEQAYGSGTNLIAERTGKSGKVLVVSAHYDSVNNAGADDDGTGVVTMLATAKLLDKKALKHTVRFVAFDEEELGLIGSKAYAKSLKGEKANILGDVQMEMMGYNAKKDGKFHVISCDRADSQFMVDAFEAVVKKLDTGLVITRACTDRSDHASFWNEDMPAIVMSENFFGGDANPCYHKKCDKMDRMHMDYFERVAEASANLVASIVLE